MADQLHPRERQVLEGLARGLTHAEIAAELHLSVASVKTYTLRLYETLGVHNAPHAVSVGYQRGLLRLPAEVPVAEDDFHRVLAALNPPEGVTELAEALLEALRLGHRMAVAKSPRNTWGCGRCGSWVQWTRASVVAQSTTLRQGQTCAEAARSWPDAPQVMRGVLVEHDRTEAGRG